MEKVLELGWHMQRKGGEVLGMELLSLLTLKVNLGRGDIKTEKPMDRDRIELSVNLSSMSIKNGRTN